jgi:Type I restriction modification DNA specificity domain
VVVPLDKLVQVTPGFSVPGAIHHDPAGEYQILLPRHIDEDGSPFVYVEQLHAARMTLPGRAGGYLVQPGDVLFMARGERNRAAVIRSCPLSSVASSAFFVLHPNSDSVLPEYLAWYLNQVPAQTAIAQIRTGAGTPLVQRPQFGALPIPVPQLAQQKTIAGLADLMLREKQLARQLTEAATRRHRAIGQALITRLTNKKEH